MNRNQFIKLSVLGGFAISASPLYAFQNKFQVFSPELFGKGDPKLFGNGYLLKEEAHLAFENMRDVALKSDINIKVVSSYRSYSHQNRIWERKYKDYLSRGMTPKKVIDKIIEYSTIPGTSRHHWGTEIDIIDANPKSPKHLLSPSNFKNNGVFAGLKEWMDKNANAFGYYLVYTDDIKRKGFKYEPWHYSYKPLSVEYLNIYRKQKLGQLFKNEALMGSEYFTDSFIETYRNENILDINPELL